MTGITSEMLAILAAATPAEEVKQRQGPGGKLLDYIDARFVMDRLDEIGAENWQDRYEDRPDGSVRAGIGILIDGDWIWKWDVGTESDIESVKGAYSDAFKRAAVKWGIGRDLYDQRQRPSARAERPVAPRQAPASVSVPDEPPEVAEAFVARQAPAVVPDRVRAEANGKGGFCDEHGVAWRLVPAGTSAKTGKTYEAFWACSSRGCNRRPSIAWVASQEMTE